MRIGPVLVGLLLCAFVAGLPARQARADGVFSAQSVFARPEANNIDDRCVSARDFAERAAKGTAGIDAYAAVAAEHAFVACLYRKRLQPNDDDLRYLILAAATAAYMGALRSDGPSSAILLRQADDMAADLGAKAPDRPWRLVEERLGSVPDKGGQRPKGRIHYVDVLKPDVFGRSHALKFADVATQLREAITKALGDETSAAPSPTP
jgi:hypothetical protein